MYGFFCTRTHNLLVKLTNLIALQSSNIYSENTVASRINQRLRMYSIYLTVRSFSSWFYESCSRDEAENILTVGRKFGNVLMRPSSTFAQTGKYVISMRREVSGWVTQRPANVLYVTCRSRDWNDESQHKVVTSFWTLLQRNKLESLWSHQEIGRLQN